MILSGSRRHSLVSIASCSIVSVMTKIPVRASLAMTGEITLRGRILPIVDLCARLGIPATPASRPQIVVAQRDDVAVGLALHHGGIAGAA